MHEQDNTLSVPIRHLEKASEGTHTEDSTANANYRLGLSILKKRHKATQLSKQVLGQAAVQPDQRRHQHAKAINHCDLDASGAVCFATRDSPS
eukprot:5119786-Pleurochrysis_carterae.AAC.5